MCARPPRRAWSPSAGFSLLESTVVIMAAAIVAATAGPGIVEYLDSARALKARGDVSVIVTSLRQLMYDVGELKGRDGALPSLLVSSGDPPELYKGGDPEWILPVDGRIVQELSHHLVDNTAGYPMGSGKARRWRGPYIEGLTTDPWGTRYSINVGCLNVPATDFVTVLVSAGPNHVIETKFRSAVVADTHGDDLVALVSTGKFEVQPSPGGPTDSLCSESPARRP